MVIYVVENKFKRNFGLNFTIFLGSNIEAKFMLNP